MYHITNTSPPLLPSQCHPPPLPHHQAKEKDSQPLVVTHYHFTEWPDHGVPRDKMSMISFIQQIRKAHPPEGPPLLVHCSAGVGRTGTFIVLDTMLQRMRAEGNLNIYEFVTQLREQRCFMVQTQVYMRYTINDTANSSHYKRVCTQTAPVFIVVNTLVINDTYISLGMNY